MRCIAEPDLEITSELAVSHAAAFCQRPNVETHLFRSGFPIRDDIEPARAQPTQPDNRLSINGFRMPPCAAKRRSHYYVIQIHNSNT
jgi:hypothetical protein